MNLEFLIGLFEDIPAFFEGWDPAVVCIVCAVLALAIIWIFVQVVRTVAMVCIGFCVVFLVLKTGFDIDLMDYLDFGSKEVESAPASLDFPKP